MLGSVLWALAAVPAALANPIAVAEPEVHFEDPRACTPPANYVKNPGFETGTLGKIERSSQITSRQCCIC